MNNRNILIGVVVVLVVLAGAGAVWAMRGGEVTPTPAPVSVVATTTPTGVVCSQEAKVCADGSTVGRTGPSCEFSACSTTGTQAESTTAALNQRILTNEVYITPLEVVEDSRCPTDVQCIQAGTVRLSAKIEGDGGTKTVIFTIGSPISFGSKHVTLMSVAPAKNSKIPTTSGSYRFTFSVAPGMGEATGTLNGTMTIGPICPVERVGQTCTPTAEMFATHKIAVYKADKKTLVTTITPKADGTYSTSLTTGTYYVAMKDAQPAVGGATGVPTTIVIKGGVATRLNIDIDTGIR